MDRQADALRAQAWNEETFEGRIQEEHNANLQEPLALTGEQVGCIHVSPCGRREGVLQTV